MDKYKQYVEFVKILNIKDFYDISYEPTEDLNFNSNCPTINNSNTYIPTNINYRNTLIPTNSNNITLIPTSMYYNINDSNSFNNNSNFIIIITTTLSSIMFLICSYIMYKLYRVKYYRLNKKKSIDNFGTNLNEIIDF
jgi:hypothetical protein